MTHQAAGVNEPIRAVVVPLSTPIPPHQTARATAAATVVPYSYRSGGRSGGP